MPPSRRTAAALLRAGSPRRLRRLPPFARAPHPHRVARRGGGTRRRGQFWAGGHAPGPRGRRGRELGGHIPGVLRTLVPDWGDAVGIPAVARHWEPTSGVVGTPSLPLGRESTGSPPAPALLGCNEDTPRRALGCRMPPPPRNGRCNKDASCDERVAGTPPTPNCRCSKDTPRGGSAPGKPLPTGGNALWL